MYRPDLEREMEQKVTEGDVQATLEFVEHIYNYLPELGMVTVYALVVYAAVKLINKYIK